jgi:3-hydroxybutyryl-CoA dehydrogenase
MHFLCKKAVMNLLLLADEERKTEFLQVPPGADWTLQWFDHLPVELKEPAADLVIDLLFENDPFRISWLQQHPFLCVMVNWTGKGLPANFVRFNGWPGFIGRALIEASCEDETIRLKAGSYAEGLGRVLEWTPDDGPFVGQLIVGSIINEAFLAFGEGTGTQEGIDTAMKLGTNYPFGPFEWAERIGCGNLVSVLLAGGGESRMDTVSILLKEKALAQ